MIFWLFPLLILIIAIYFNWDKFSSNISNKHLCFICDIKLSEAQAHHYDHKSFCSKHIDTYKSSTWVKIYTLECNPNEPEKGVHLYELKRQLSLTGRPCYLESDYTEKDGEIITIMNLYSTEKDKEEVLRLLPF